MSSLSTFAQYSTEKLDLSSDVSLWFDQQIGLDQTPLVLGTYQRIQISTNTHPFFLDKFWIEGSINYRGEVFRQVKMMYNVYEDYLIITHPTNLTIASQPIRLDVSQIDWFDFKGNRFVNYQNIGEKSGIYHELYSSNQISFVAKRAKKEHIEKATDPLGYRSFDTYHLIYKNNIYTIKGKAGFIRIFPELKKEIKNHVKTEGLIVSRKNENGMIALASFCNTKIGEK